MRKVTNLNYDWMFKEKFEYSDMNEGNFEGFIKVDIPHTLKILPYNYFNYEDYKITSSYKRILKIRKSKDKRYLLKFLGIAQSSSIYINGIRAIENNCGYNEIFFDATDYLKGGNNEIYVMVSSKEDYFPPFGNIVDYLGFGGIYREVYLIEVSDTYLYNPFIYETNLLDDSRKLHFSVEFNSHEKEKIGLLIKDNNKLIVESDKMIESGKDYKYDFNMPDLWSPENPKLYDVYITLSKDGEVIDELSFKYGFRSIKADKKGLLLNGEYYLLRGLDRHQSFPYVGYAMPINMQIKDLEIMKYELGCNTYRCSHYMNHPELLNKADEIGLIVYEEFPGWQYIGNDNWKRQAMINLESMILRDRCHPSIFFFGVRINESPDDYEFNKECFEAAKRLDPSRLITGTRNFLKGLHFDDVYAYNNFDLNLTEDAIYKRRQVVDSKTPYLITEYCGHMYPNKPYDTEHRRNRAALNHKNVISHVEKENGIIGATGWVFSDYNTHIGFGPNDMICYHGVTDMFRNPKTSSNTYRIYASEPYLEVSSDFDAGDFNKMWLEGPVLFTNCDKVEVYRDDRLIKTYDISKDIDDRIFRTTAFISKEIIMENENKTEKEASALLNQIDTILKYDYDDKVLESKINLKSSQEAISLIYKYVHDPKAVYTYKGYINGLKVKEIKRGMPYFDHYDTELSHEVLEVKDTYQIIKVTVIAKSNFDTVLRYLSEPIQIKVSSGLEVVGDQIRSIIGGYASFYVRNKEDISSSEKITLISQNRPKIELKLDVVGSKNGNK